MEAVEEERGRGQTNIEEITNECPKFDYNNYQLLILSPAPSSLWRMG